MGVPRTLTGVVTLLLVALAPAAGLSAAGAEDEADFAQLLAQKADPLVTIKFVLKSSGRWGDSDDEREATGILVDAAGLILCSKSELGDYGGFYGNTRSMPTEIKILIGSDSEGVEAKLVARDSELDLVWLQITEAHDHKLPYIKLEDHAVPEIGDRIYFVDRMSKYFDRVAVVGEGRIGGKTRKPRKLFVPAGGGGSLGLPVYDAQGRFLGVPIRLQPDREERDSDAALYGGWGLILPADQVAKATQRARLVAKQAESDEEANAEAKSGSEFGDGTD